MKPSRRISEVVPSRDVSIFIPVFRPGTIPEVMTCFSSARFSAITLPLFLFGVEANIPRMR